jgi:hypothetical protein
MKVRWRWRLRLLLLTVSRMLWAATWVLDMLLMLWWRQRLLLLLLRRRRLRRRAHRSTVLHLLHQLVQRVLDALESAPLLRFLLRQVGSGKLLILVNMPLFGPTIGDLLFWKHAHTRLASTPRPSLVDAALHVTTSIRQHLLISLQRLLRSSGT